MVDITKPTDQPCEGCGAGAGEPCNPHMACQESALEPQYGSAQTIHEVGWKLRKEVTREAYLRDLVYAGDLKFPVNEWRGLDRVGRPTVIVWVTTGESGSLLSAYEIQGRA
jgi:hypothetical protein